MIAAVSASPEWALSDEESKALAERIAEVNRHYPMPVINPAHASLIALATTAAGLYIPRIIASVSKGKKKKAEEKQARTAPNVVDINSGSWGGIPMPQTAHAG